MQEQEFGAQQPDPLPTRLDGVRRFINVADVGHDLDARAVGHDRRLVAGLALGIALRLVIHQHVARLRRIGFRRLDHQQAGVAVEDGWRAVFEIEHGITGAHYRRDIQGPGDDRGVRRGAATGGAESERELGIEPGGVRRSQVLGDENDRLVRKP